jgi:protein TonB
MSTNPRTELVGQHAGPAPKQPRQLRIALVLLLAALGIVIATNRDFWFGADEAQVPDAPRSETIAKVNSVTSPAQQAQAPVATEKSHIAAKTPVKPLPPAPSPTTSANPHPPVVATRTVLPPLEVEVIAGDAHRTVHPGSNVTNVEIQGSSNRASAVTAPVGALPANAAEHEPLSPVTAPALRQTIDATYPLLGHHTSVQGSVVLQAVVGTDGTIEDLRIVSGPAILTAAAQQAVRQWRFKPYLQNGQPVETKARITVNFSIKVSDNPAKTS